MRYLRRYKRLVLVLAAAALISVFMAPAIVSAADLPINPDAPNCFDTGKNGYETIDCATIQIFWGKPLENGHCYVVTPTLPLPSAHEAKCADLQAQAALPTTSPTTGTTPGTQTRAQAIDCPQGTTDTGLQQCLQANPVVTRFNDILNFFGIGVGVIVVIMVIVGGIQYAAAGSNPQAVAAAKKRILNAIIALVAFMLLYSFMQYLLPGGAF
jgi:hypothetical protein